METPPDLAGCSRTRDRDPVVHPLKVGVSELGAVIGLSVLEEELDPHRLGAADREVFLDHAVTAQLLTVGSRAVDGDQVLSGLILDVAEDVTIAVLDAGAQHCRHKTERGCTTPDQPSDPRPHRPKPSV